MTEIFINRMNDYYELSEFELDADDVYEARCAEIFITLNRALAFHCSFCDKTYGSFEYLLKHLSIEHYGKMHEQEKYEANPVEDIQSDLDQVKEESNNTDNGSLDPLDETLHEYDDLQYTEKFKVEEGCENKISDKDSHSELSQDGQEYLKEIENIVILNRSHNSSDETWSTDQETLEENLSSWNRCKSHEVPSPTNSKPTTLLDTNASEEKLKKKQKKKNGLFKCDICSKTFNSKANMKFHLITHSSERKHKCEYCGFAFKHRCNLLAHVRRHTGQKTIGCDICPKKFYTRTECEHHKRIHTGEKPYICSFCGLAFQTSSRMTAHSKRHTEEAPLKCSYCKKEFWTKPDMRDHLLVHTKEKPFACPICSARFPRLKSMRRHTKLHEK